MSPLPHPRHELLAQKYVVGLARGEPQTTAYKAAGYRGKGHGAEVAASRMLKRVEVVGRIQELQAIAAMRTATTIERLTAELDQARALAFATGSAAAGVAASIAKAKLHGLWITRSERPQPAPAQSIDEVVEAMIQEVGDQGALDVVRAMEIMILRRIRESDEG